MRPFLSRASKAQSNASDRNDRKANVLAKPGSKTGKAVHKIVKRVAPAASKVFKTLTKPCRNVVKLSKRAVCQMMSARKVVDVPSNSANAAKPTTCDKPVTKVPTFNFRKALRPLSGRSALPLRRLSTIRKVNGLTINWVDAWIQAFAPTSTTDDIVRVHLAISEGHDGDYVTVKMKVVEQAWVDGFVVDWVDGWSAMFTPPNAAFLKKFSWKLLSKSRKKPALLAITRAPASDLFQKLQQQQAGPSLKQVPLAFNDAKMKGKVARKGIFLLHNIMKAGRRVVPDADAFSIPAIHA